MRVGTRYEGLVKFKKQFLLNNYLDPLSCPFLDKEIAASWLRSRNAGVDPYCKAVVQNLPSLEYIRQRDKKRFLIDVARPLLDSFSELIIKAGFTLLLNDASGFVLAQKGQPTVVPKIDEDTGYKIKCDESMAGTMAYNLCIQLKKPVQLSGAEHYCVTFHNLIASSAPVFDDSGNMLAVLTLSQPLPSYGVREEDKASSLSLVISMATIIENKLKLKNNCTRLKTAINGLKTTLSLIDKSAIIINNNGEIVLYNKNAKQLLEINDTGFENYNILDFIDKESRFHDLLKRWEKIDITDNIFKNKDTYNIKIRPITNYINEKAGMSILTFEHTNKANTLKGEKLGSSAFYKFENIIGESKPIKSAVAQGQRFALSTENLLLTGDTGTGKELFAHAIHNMNRPKGPFISVNCAAMPKELIESELFGYEKGSFTGAGSNGRVGKIEMADNGTLYLDEIGDMPLELQAVLLRVLQDKQVMRVGGNTYKKVDFRLITSTNKDLSRAIQENRFRPDLFFRISVLSIRLPSLKERREDISLLAKFFIGKYSEKKCILPPELSWETVKILDHYDWPGNIRQLENAMIYAVDLTRDNIIEPDNLPELLHHAGNDVPVKITGPNDKEFNIKKQEAELIKNAMLQTDNHVLLAADLLGMHRSTLYRKLREIGYTGAKQ